MKDDVVTLFFHITLDLQSSCQTARRSRTEEKRRQNVIAES